MSAKKVMGDMGAPFSNSVELASFHTISKGVLGECGLRGGYVELTNFHPGAVDELYKVCQQWIACAVSECYQRDRCCEALTLSTAPSRACRRLRPSTCRPTPLARSA